MNTLKDLQIRLMSMYSRVIKDHRQQDEYREHLTINRVSRQVKYYRSQFLQQ